MWFNAWSLQDQDVEEVLRGLAEADSAQAVQQSGAVLLALLQKARQRHRDITTQEMSVLIHERDHTAAKVSFHGYSRGCVPMVTAAGAVFPWLQQQGLCSRGYSSRGCVPVVTAAGAVFPWLQQQGLCFRGYSSRGCVSVVSAGAVFPWLQQQGLPCL